MKVTTSKPKQLAYDLPKELQYSKGGVFVKTKKLYIKEFVYGELEELNDKLDDFLDEFEKCKEKSKIASLSDSIEIMASISKMIEIEAKNSPDKTEADLRAELDSVGEKAKNDIETLSLQELNMAKKGGLSTSYLKKALLPFLTNYIYCDEEKTVKITSGNLKELGIAQRGLLDFFLVGGLLSCYISLDAKSK